MHVNPRNGNKASQLSWLWLWRRANQTRTGKILIASLSAAIYNSDNNMCIYIYICIYNTPCPDKREQHCFVLNLLQIQTNCSNFLQATSWSYCKTIIIMTRCICLVKTFLRKFGLKWQFNLSTHLTGVSALHG